MKSVIFINVTKENFRAEIRPVYRKRQYKYGLPGKKILLDI